MVRWFTGELVTTGRPAYAADQTAPIEGAQHLVQVGLRHLLARGNLAALHGTLAVMQREIVQCPNPVISAT